VPLYEYQCRKCRHRFERIQKFSDPPAAKCPECGGKVEQLISAPAVRFKGTGWYATDYGGKSLKGGTKRESKSEPAGESKSESKPESKDKK